MKIAIALVALVFCLILREKTKARLKKEKKEIRRLMNDRRILLDQLTPAGKKYYLEKRSDFEKEIDNE